jgi:Fe-S-cluster-containing dehydrogenase component
MDGKDGRKTDGRPVCPLLTRREALQVLGIGGGFGIAVLVGGCNPQPSPTATAAAPATATTAPTATATATATTAPTATATTAPTATATATAVAAQTTDRKVFVADAKGMIVAQPTRCVGCRRCELACTEFNDGKAQPSIARIKVARNYSFGPQGAQLGFWRGEGRYGNHRIVQETCRQCPHPVPCQLACPNDAIEVTGPVNARVVNPDKCVGCRTCEEACPWEMTSFDQELQKATKCHLCDGEPECVQACPVGALQYVSWEDTTGVIPRRFVVPAYIRAAAGVQESCAQCH